MWPFKKKFQQPNILTPRQIKEAIKFATNNKEVLAKSNLAGCYYCLEIYPANEVEDFLAQENTALCPKCQIDTVLGDKIDFPINKITLKELHNFWFSDRGWSIFADKKDGYQADIFTRKGMTKDDKKKMPWILELFVTLKFANDNLSQEEKLQIHNFINDVDTELRKKYIVESIVKLNWFVYQEAFFSLDKSENISELIADVAKKHSPQITWQSNLKKDPKWETISKYLRV